MLAGEQVTAVEPAFNRLTLFDPRLPHGVRAVAGTRDPRRGRLVVTGWFTEPTPFFNGASLLRRQGLSTCTSACDTSTAPAR
jgi:Rps23 Pro-64 3,4-dihydroxylase Tpa1-like proline 4-hydroxylase